MKKERPLWYTLLDKETRARVDALNKHDSLPLAVLDYEVKRLHDAFNEVSERRSGRWKLFASELLGLEPGDVFKENHLHWLYVGFSPKAIPLRELKSTESRGPEGGDFFVDMWVLPFEQSGRAQVQLYSPSRLPFAAVRKVEVPELAALWVKTRDPALDIAWMSSPFIDVEVRVKIPIRIPASVPRKKPQKRR